MKPTRCRFPITGRVGGPGGRPFGRRPVNSSRMTIATATTIGNTWKRTAMVMQRDETRERRIRMIRPIWSGHCRPVNRPETIQDPAPLLLEIVIPCPDTKTRNAVPWTREPARLQGRHVPHRGKGGISPTGQAQVPARKRRWDSSNPGLWAEEGVGGTVQMENQPCAKRSQTRGNDVLSNLLTDRT